MGFNVKFLIILATVMKLAEAQHGDPITNTGNVCGCKLLRPCYADMLYELTERDEQMCMDDIEIGTSTYMIYFKALQTYCGHFFNVTAEYFTAESRLLYEVAVHLPKETDKDKGSSEQGVPIVMIEAGQAGGILPVRVALSFIERLVACEENESMIQNVKWVFLPCTNPDGLEYVRFDRPDWEKNTRKTGEGASYGIDVSRNFDIHWNECEKSKSILDRNYPGPYPFSEAETKFIKNMLLKYKDQLKAYLSMRRKGHHGMFYPHAYTDKIDDVDPHLINAAGTISVKVNTRGGLIQAFINDSIYQADAKPTCGHSVDYAHSLGIPMAFEFRVGFEKDMDVLNQFQHVGPSYFLALRQAYFAGIRELYTMVKT